MTSTIGWIELSPSSLRKLRRDLESQSEGVLDEMGVGAIHTGYADRFFPGTSVLHKRPRYLFFTCWNYLKLNRLDPALPSAERKLVAEKWVRDQLIKTRQRGIIGAIEEHPAQPVDFVYWTALRTWGFYRGVDRSTLIRKWDAVRPTRLVIREVADSERVIEQPQAAFFVKAPPHYWLRPRPNEALTFDLERNEAEFLQARLISLPPCILSAAAAAAYRIRADGSTLWDDELIREAAERRGDMDALERSRLASTIALIVRATYAALVERRCNETRSAQRSDHYRSILLQAVDERQRADVGALELGLLDQDLLGLSRPLLSLLRHVQLRVSRIRRPSDADRLLLDETTMTMCCAEEVRRKGYRRARLPDTALGAEHRAGFDEETLNVTGLEYRWSVFSGSRQSIQVQSSPAATKVTTTPETGEYTTPTTLNLERKNSYTLHFEKEGYSPATFQIQNHTRGGIVVLDVLLTGLVGVVVDAATGPWNGLSPEAATVRSNEDRGSPGPPTRSTSGSACVKKAARTASTSTQARRALGCASNRSRIANLETPRWLPLSRMERGPGGGEDTDVTPLHESSVMNLLEEFCHPEHKTHRCGRLRDPEASALCRALLPELVAQPHDRRDRPYHHGQGKGIRKRPGAARAREVTVARRVALAGGARDLDDSEDGYKVQVQ